MEPTLKQILWADDEIQLLQPYILFLRDKGYEVTPVCSGQDAIDAFEEDSFDIVFLDEQMPGMSGLDFAVQLKQLCPDTILIFVTAYSQYALEAFRLHVHGYILKPLTEARVREELDYALKRIGKRRSAKLPQGQDQTRGAGAGAGAASD